MLKYCFFLILLIGFLQVNAQKRDSIAKPADTGKVRVPFKTKLNNTFKEIGGLFGDSTKLQTPRKAVLRSAILPGWGQVRNKQWWKVPLVYGGFAGIGLVYNFYNVEFRGSVAESQFRKATPGGNRDIEFLFPEYQSIPDQQIFEINNFYRRNRDLSLYVGILFYGIHLADAYTSARLATFDVSDDLTFKLKPSIYMPNYAQVGTNFAPVPMLTLSIKMK